jgi:predicted CoA-binding protein
MRVMIVGASSNPRKYGNKAVRAYQRAGHEVLPVHPNEDVVEGISTWADVREVPPPIDRVSFYVPAAIGFEVLRRLKQRGDIREIWLNPGAESPELVAEARRLGITPILGCSIVDIGEIP